jgi:probable F420-dependent oxidoreductase
LGPNAASPKRFRFGVMSGIFSWTSRELRDIARKVEDLGYDTFQLSDHVAGPGPAMERTGHPPGGIAVAPALMALACATERLRVGTTVSCIDYHHPVVLAHEMATIDLLSDGRLELGLGAGWLRGEYEAMGIDFDPAPTRVERLGEAVRLIKMLFSGGQVSFKGQYYQVEGFEGAPRPVQTPGPPIMIGGGSKRVLQLAGREADMASLNYNNRTGTLLGDGFRESTERPTLEKVEWIRQGAGDRDIEIHAGGYFTEITNDPRSVATQMAETFGVTPEDVMSHPHALIGSTDAICDELQRRRELYGVSYVSVGAHIVDEFAPVVQAMAGK